jgi:hypothetical protein
VWIKVNKINIFKNKIKTNFTGQEPESMTISAPTASMAMPLTRPCSCGLHRIVFFRPLTCWSVGSLCRQQDQCPGHRGGIVIAGRQSGVEGPGSSWIGDVFCRKCLTETCKGMPAPASKSHADRVQPWHVLYLDSRSFAASRLSAPPVVTAIQQQFADLENQLRWSLVILPQDRADLA